MLTKQLESFGLSPAEAHIYLACLELGAASVLEISRKTKQNRAQLYLIIDRLIEKKLVTVAIVGKRKRFVPEQPAVLRALFQEKLLDLDMLIPDLVALARKGTIKPIIKFYDGLEGIKDVYRASSRGKDRVLYGFIGLDKLNTQSKALLHFWLNELTTLRKRHKAIGKVIIPDTEQGRLYKSSEKEKFRETRLVPASTYNFPGAIIVFDDTVCAYVFSDKEAFAVSIESVAIAETVKMVWQLVWAQAY